MEFMTRYNPSEIEPKWQKKWSDDKLYEAEDFSKKQKFVMLTEFPYPSGDGLHLGHAREYTLGDIMARHKRMQGYNVLYPMGYDAFGLPTENYAIKNKIRPQDATDRNVGNFQKQFERLGYSIDWSRSFRTTDPDYYRWTQWLFLQFYKHGLAYQDDIEINWCPKCKTGLANEEVVNGLHERCDTPVEKKQLRQWMLQITKYADKLIENLETVDYPSRIADQQINWIGRSIGAEIDFDVKEDVRPNYVLLHGFTGRADRNWLPWVSESLSKKGYKVQTPQLPNTDEPTEKEQVDYVLNNCDIDENTVLVGHSLGGAVAMKVLEKLEKPIRELVLVAPVIEPAFRGPNYENEGTNGKRRNFVDTFDLSYNYDLVMERAGHIKILSDVTEKSHRKAYLEFLSDKLKAPLYETTAQKIHFRGTEEPFILEKLDSKIKIFTTRADTIFGASFMVLAPEHDLVQQITTAEQRQVVEDYIKQAQSKSEVERQDTDREKTGVFTGAYAINPLNGDEIPVWIADYVLAGYGTGAIMAVPAHDMRDYEFAKKFDLPIKQVVAEEFNERIDDAERLSGVNVIGYDPETDRFMGLHNHKVDKPWLVSGGHDDGEDYEQTALRELAEEAGYHEVKDLISLGGFFYTYFYNPTKQSKRKGTGKNYLAIISEQEQVSSANEEHEKYSVVWWSRDDLQKVLKKWSDVDSDHWVRALEDALAAADAYKNGEVFVPEQFTGDGVLVNSDAYDDVPSAEAREQIVQHLERQGKGKLRVNYRLRDWIFSRQHYWGEPIPIIHCDEHGAVAVPDDQLPVTLPEVEFYEPTDTGESPLAAIADWVETTCPTCGGPARRETDTMPNWAGSSWYYLRYFDAKNDKAFADPKKLEYWGMVDLYLGGMEHTTLHLLYSRFWHEFFHDIGLVPTPEPYAARRGQGIILAEDGRKMSKSLGNVVNPLEVVDAGYGADALRVAIAFIAPYDLTTPWSAESVAGTHRFLNRVWTLVQEHLASEKDGSVPEKLTHQAAKKVSEDLDSMHFNTAIAGMMEYVNELYKLKSSGMKGESWRLALKWLLKVLAPFAPHMTEELWSQMGFEGSIHVMDWPKYDEAKLAEDTITIVLQVNGKLRAQISAPAGASKEELEKLALDNDRVKEFVGNKKPTRVIVVPGRLVNVVV